MGDGREFLVGELMAMFFFFLEGGGAVKSKKFFFFLGVIAHVSHYIFMSEKSRWLISAALLGNNTNFCSQCNTPLLIC